MIYIANDVEASGSRLGFHSALSLGACVVTRESIRFDEFASKGLVFYTEMKPHTHEFETEAMRVGCLHLKCLEKIRHTDTRYEPKSQDFMPDLVLERMQEACEEPKIALARFREWLSSVSNGQKVEGITDTVFFDSGHINFCFGVNEAGLPPFGWKGLDLSSMYRGFTGRESASLKELDVLDTRIKPHRADHDAVFLAQMARELIYETLKW